MTRVFAPPRHSLISILVAVLTAAVLMLTAGEQVYDANLYALAESTAILAGDVPNRDFFEVGIPLAAYLAAGFQALAGHRLIGEFLRQWLFIVGGMVVAYRLGLALSRSVGATLTVLALALVVLASAPTYHHDKLFFFPLMIWVGWRYLDKPDAQGAWLLGTVTALGFLFRHDYGIYLGFGACTALALARYTEPASRALRAIRNDLFACALAVAIIVAPWALWVQTTEGLLEYTRMRMALSQRPDKPVYASLLTRNPLRTLMPERRDPMPAVVGFLWQPAVDEQQQRALEHQFRLRRMVKQDSGGRLLYEVPNAYDVGLLGLDPYIMDGVGFQWDRLRDLQAGLPSRDNVTLWLQHVALLVPLVLIGAGGARLWRSRRTSAPVDPDAARMLLAGTFLVVVNSGILREPSYVVVVVPVVAALAARFVVSRNAAVRLCAIGVLAATTFAVFVRERGSLLLHPSRYRASVSVGLEALLATPDDVRNPYRYLHECTAPGDRLLITGITPSYLSYYAQRPFAGGHIAWHQGWRSDPEHESQLLARLERQSVPLVVSGASLEDLRAYPRIRDYVEKHYRVVEDADLPLLVDTRRRPVRGFGPRQYPCFQ